MDKAHWIVLCVSLAAAIIAGSWFGISFAQATAAANAFAEQQNEQVAKEVINDAQNEALENISQEATGISHTKIDDDAEVIEDVATLVYTWTSGEEYRDNRQALIDDYGVAEDSSFMTEFMPPLPAYTKSDGSTVDDVDELSLHSTLVSVEPFVTGMTNNGYDYYCIVTSSSSDTNGAQAQGESALSCHIDAAGRVTNLNATTFIGKMNG